MSITVKLSEERKRLLVERSKVHEKRLVVASLLELKKTEHERSHPNDKKHIEDTELPKICELLADLDLQIDNYNEMLIDLRTLESLANINAINAQIAAQQQEEAQKTESRMPPQIMEKVLDVELSKHIPLIQDASPPKDNAEQGVEFTEVVSDRPGYVRFEEVIPN